MTKSFGSGAARATGGAATIETVADKKAIARIPPT